MGDVGRVDLVEERTDADYVKAKAKDLHKSVQKLLKLPDWIEIYPGHYKGSACGKGMDSKSTSALGRERRKNQALQLDGVTFTRYLLENTLPPLPDFLKIKQQNTGKL